MRFLYIALGSGSELHYLAGLTKELGYCSGPQWDDIMRQSDSVARQLQRLVQRMEQFAEEETKKGNRAELRPKSSETTH